MVGSDPSTTDYPGKIPCGLDPPSDIANENLGKEEKSDSWFTKTGGEKRLAMKIHFPSGERN